MEYMFKTKREPERVLEVLKRGVDRFGSLSVSNVNDLVGLPQNTEDNNNKRGWTSLEEATIEQRDDGWVLILPPVEDLTTHP